MLCPLPGIFPCFVFNLPSPFPFIVSKSSPYLLVFDCISLAHTGFGVSPWNKTGHPACRFLCFMPAEYKWALTPVYCNSELDVFVISAPLGLYNAYCWGFQCAVSCRWVQLCECWGGTVALTNVLSVVGGCSYVNVEVGLLHWPVLTWLVAFDQVSRAWFSLSLLI